MCTKVTVAPLLRLKMFHTNPPPPLRRPPAVPAAILSCPDDADILGARRTSLRQDKRDAVPSNPLRRIVDAHQLGAECRTWLVSRSRPDLPGVVVAEREEDDVVAHVCGFLWREEYAVCWYSKVLDTVSEPRCVRGRSWMMYKSRMPRLDNCQELLGGARLIVQDQCSEVRLRDDSTLSMTVTAWTSTWTVQGNIIRRRSLAVCFTSSSRATQVANAITRRLLLTDDSSSMSLSLAQTGCYEIVIAPRSPHGRAEADAYNNTNLA